MNAMILAAGRGERMRPLTDTCPKPLLTIHDKPLIVYHLEALKKAGIQSVVINVSWLADQIIDFLGDGKGFDLGIRYSHETEALETAGGIIQALDKLDDEFIVVNGDVYTDYDFSRLKNFTGQAQLVLVPNPAHNPQGDFSIQDGFLQNSSDQHYTFSGIGGYQKSFFSGLAQGKRALGPLLRERADNKSIGAELFNGLWNDIGTPQRLAQLQEL